MVPEEKPEEEDEVSEPIELDELEGTPFSYFYLFFRRFTTSHEC